MTLHQDTAASNEALAPVGSRMLPGAAYVGFGPWPIKAAIRENLMGRKAGRGYRLLEGSVRVFFQSPQTCPRE